VGTADPDGVEVTCVGDDDDERLLVGVQAGAVKLAAVVPADLPRGPFERALVDCARQLSHYAVDADRSDVEAPGNDHPEAEPPAGERSGADRPGTERPESG
jgi:hypothetical protein